METDLSLKQMQKQWQGSYRAYFIGFILSLILTGLSFYLVVDGSLSHYTLMGTIGLLALIQATVQIKYFLHLGREGSPHWETGSFLFMFVILVIIVAGSLWIMYDLEQRTMANIMQGMSHD